MQRKPEASTLSGMPVAAFLLVSAALAVTLLGVRNLYDDEIFSYYLVTAKPRTILEVASQGDVHPPGMYLLAHLAHLAMPSPRWMNLLPGLVLYAGLGVFLFGITPQLRKTRARLCLLLLATMHPQLLMWGMTFRWYSGWTGLALITLTIALQPREVKPVLSIARAVALGLLLACLFYLNYITLFFGVALAGAMGMRYRAQTRASLLKRGVYSLGIFLVPIAPQIRTMISVHLRDGRAQRYGVGASFLRLLQSIAASEAYLPWNPLALVAGVIFLVLCVAGCLTLVRLARHHEPLTMPRGALASIILFGVLFFLLVAASGLGGKPRNGLLLIPVLAPAAALMLESLRPRAQIAILLFFALWSADGTAHLLGRYGLMKATMNDRPEEVIALLRAGRAQKQGSAACAVVVTYDGLLAFELAAAQLPHVLVISPYRVDFVSPGTARTLGAECSAARLYVVHSFFGGSVARAKLLDRDLYAAEQSIEGPHQIDRLDRDPDAAIKWRLARVSGMGGSADAADRLPDFRYVVVSGGISPASVAAMRLRMPQFVSGYAVGPREDLPSP